MFFSRRYRYDINDTTIIIGENTDRRAYCSIPIGTHAEIDALQKMKYIIKKRKRIETLSMMVIRFTKAGQMRYARPCYHCIKQLMQAKFLRIKDIYYSDVNGAISCEKICDMLDSPRTVISSGYKFRMYIQENKKKIRH